LSKRRYFHQNWYCRNSA